MKQQPTERAAPRERPGEARPPRRVLRRLGAFALGAVLLLLDATMALYLLRQPVLAPWLLDVAETQLSAALDAEVRIGALGGNWITTLEVRDIEIRGNAGAAVERVEGGRLLVSLDPLTLAAGDLAGLESARVTAESVAVRLGAGEPQPEPPPPEDESELDLSALARVFPGGFEIEARSLALETGDGSRRAPLELWLRPGAGERELLGRWGGSSVTASLTPGAEPRSEARVVVDGPGELLRMLGTPNRLQGGRAVVRVRGELDPGTLEGRLALADVSFRNKDLERSEVSFRLDEELLRIGGADVDLPGIRLHGRGLSMPSPLGNGGDLLTRVDGAIDVQVDDLDPYRELLPPEVRELLPVRARLAGRVQGGALVVDAAELRTEGMHLRATPGRIPLRAEAAVESPGSVAFALEIPEPKEIRLGDVEPAVVQGFVRGRIGGSLEQPILNAELALGDGKVAGLQWDEIRGSARYGGAEVEIAEMVLEGIRAGAGAPPSRVELAATARLPTGQEPVRVRARTAGTLHPALLALADVDPALRERMGPVSFRLEAAGSTGDGAFPEVTASAALTDLRFDGQPPVALEWRGSLSPQGVLEIEKLSLSGDLSLDATGRVALDGEGLLQLLVETDGIDLANVAALVAPDIDVVGYLRTRLEVGGTLAAPTVELDLGVDAVVPSPVRERWPSDSLGPPPLELALRLQAGVSDRIAIDGLSIALGETDAPTHFELGAEGTIPLRVVDGALVPGSGSDDLQADVGFRAPGTADSAPLELQASLVADAQRTALNLDRVAVGSAVMRGEIAAATTASAFVLRPQGAPDTGLSGELDLESFALAELPARTTAPARLRGVLDLAARIEGTLGTPRPRLELRWTDGAVAIDGEPWAAGMTLAVDADRNRVRLETLSGTVLDGALEARGSVSAPAGEDLTTAGSEALELDAELRLVDLALAALPLPPELGTLAGKLGLEARVAGSIGEPRPTATLTVAEGAIARPDAPDVRGVSVRVELEPGAVRLDRLQAQVARGTLTASARAGVALADVMAGEVAWAEVPIAGEVDVVGLQLSAILPGATGLADLNGELALQLGFDGTLAQPSPHGRLQLADTSVAAGAVPRISELTADIVLDPRRVEMRELRGLLGQGEFQVVGPGEGPAFVEAKGASLLAALREPEPDLEIGLGLTGRDVLLQRGRGIKIRAHPDLKLRGTLEAMTLEGRLALTNARIVKRISLLPDLSARGGSPEMERGITFEGLPRPFGSRIAVNIVVTTAEPIELRTRVVDADLDTELRLRGTAASPHLEGTVSSQEGRLAFPGTTLDLETLLLTFPAERPAFPDLLVRASGRRHSILVQLTVQGTVDNPEVLLSSSPPVPPQELVVLLTTGALPSTLREMGTQGQATLIGSFLAEEIFQTYFGSESTEETSSLIDRFRIESGREVSSEGIESLLFEFDLTDDFALQAERDVYEDYNMGLVYRIRF